MEPPTTLLSSPVGVSADATPKYASRNLCETICWACVPMRSKKSLLLFTSNFSVGTLGAKNLWRAQFEELNKAMESVWSAVEHHDLMDPRCIWTHPCTWQRQKGLSESLAFEQWSRSATTPWQCLNGGSITYHAKKIKKHDSQYIEPVWTVYMYSRLK